MPQPACWQSLTGLPIARLGFSVIDAESGQALGDLTDLFLVRFEDAAG